MIDHSCEWFASVVDVPLFLCPLLVNVGVFSVGEEIVLVDDSLAVGALSQAVIVDVHYRGLEFHFGFQLASADIDALARVELHVLYCFFRFVAEFRFEF